MSRVLIGYDCRVILQAGYKGLDADLWPRLEIESINDIEKNGINLYDEIPMVELDCKYQLVAFDAEYEIVKHIASTFGLAHCLNQKIGEDGLEGFYFLGFDVVDLYTQETYLSHIKLLANSLNEFGLINDELHAKTISKNINDTYSYDVVGVWQKKNQTKTYRTYMDAPILSNKNLQNLI